MICSVQPREFAHILRDLPEPRRKQDDIIGAVFPDEYQDDERHRPASPEELHRLYAVLFKYPVDDAVVGEKYLPHIDDRCDRHNQRREEKAAEKARMLVKG